ncbi:hypothetical protein BBK36DRAFT_1126198 [Trichoderma citrinoviride]|uniref:Uncharacterized protein n=1 Tax=Trichoderma citrinoviride TaxID=58853 RepID=A0A2T4B2D9_9HYPO|nr:hypothetical protein BBK36DRAFT_1126198 [Trichoderma citrinoviride]PTB63470.1 hypothetical protein BBK36DRAFT_1126198 [Trichoderma citrinoviride]
MPNSSLSSLSPQVTNINDVLKALLQTSEPSDSKFNAFRQFYHEITRLAYAPTGATSGDITISINPSGTSSHAAVLRSVSKLKSQCSENFTLGEFQQDAFADYHPRDKDRTTRVAVQLAFMIDPSSKDDFPMAYGIESEHVFPVKWLPSQTFVEFFQSAFPADPMEFWHSSIRKHTLRAWKLNRRLGIQIRPTNDLAEHLVYNPTTKTLAVFHQVEWLKCQVRRTLERSLEESIEMSSTNGTLPPQLLVETLYSIYYILFPIATNKKSAKFAKKLTQAKRDTDLSRSSDSIFDPNLVVYDGLIRPLPGNFKFVYWTKRLRALQTVVDKPPPSNKIISWFERHTSERNALTVAILGLFLTALFGLLSFLVGVAQLVVSLKMAP